MSQEDLQPGIRAFVRAIEDLLARRRKEVKQPEKRTPFRGDTLQRWSVQEFCSHYSPFRDMRRGKIVRPPPRSDVMKVADILCCTLEERNDILIAAEYKPEELYLQGNELVAALQETEKIVRYLPFPAYSCTRDWNIHQWNNYTPLLYGISHDELSSTPVEKRNILRYIFDPNTPVYGILNQNQEQWKYTAKLNVYWFKRENILCRYDKWYGAFVNGMKEFPEFTEIWEEVQVNSQYTGPSLVSPWPSYITEIFTDRGKKLRIRGLSISSTYNEYPVVIAYIPDDSESRQIFTEIGLPTPDNRWKT